MLKNKFIFVVGPEKQKTLSGTVNLDGRSVDGKYVCSVKIDPLPIDSGIVFEYEGMKVQALIDNILPDDEGHTTTIIIGKNKISYIEHLLSAIWGMGIDNALIKLSHPAIPFRDASSEYFSKSILKAGVSEQGKERKSLKLIQKYKYFEKGDDRYIEITPSEIPVISTHVEFNNIIGVQNCKLLVSDDNYFNHVSWARTFLRSPISDEDVSWEQIRKILPILPSSPKDSPLIVYNKEKYLVEMKDPNEAACHKTLDFIGDIALLGFRIIGDIHLYKPGHKFTRKIVLDIQSQI